MIGSASRRSADVPAPGRPVVVAITTFRRVDRLIGLVDAIRAQAPDIDVPVRVALVDNDPERSAEETAQAAGVDYINEPRPGIAAARQSALAAAVSGELVVMLDDDVVPEIGWLTELVDAHRRFAPTVVMGYVRYEWPEGSDPWIVAGGFMRRIRYPTGTVLSALSTGNVLLDADAVRALGVDFDPGLSLSGGEDTLFGRVVIGAGGTIVASADAGVRDVVPVERVTREFVRRRTVAHGEQLVALDLRSRGGLDATAARVRQFVGGVVRWVVFATLQLIGKATRNTQRDAVATRRAWFARGRIRGAWGRRTAEYGRVAGARKSGDRA